MFSAYKKREDIEAGVVIELEHGGKARLRDYGGIAFTEALLNLYISHGLAGMAGDEVPQEKRNELEQLAVIHGCIVGLYDPDSEVWVNEVEEIRALLTDPQYDELYREIKMHTMERNHFLADDSKKKTKSSLKGSRRTSKESSVGDESTPAKTSAGQTSVSSGNGHESRVS